MIQAPYTIYKASVIQPTTLSNLIFQAWPPLCRLGSSNSYSLQVPVYPLSLYPCTLTKDASQASPFLSHIFKHRHKLYQKERLPTFPTALY